MDGGRTRVKIPEGAQTARQFRLKSKGMPVLRTRQYGDMYVQIVVETPQNLSRRQRELLEEFERVSDYLGSQTFYHPQDPVESYKEAARMYFDCRRAGIIIRSAIDCLIARTAIEHDLLLLHDDRDFENMAGAIPELSLA